MNLKELSLKLGLSPTTVSRALNGYPEVNEATRDRVLVAAKRFDYRPNSRAIRLASGRSMAVGHVFPVAIKNEIMNPIFADFIAGAGEVYAPNGYDLLLSVVADDQEEAAYRELKSRGAVDGVIIHALRTDDPRIGILTSLGIPFVCHGRATDVTQDYSWVDVNNRRAFLRATDFLLDLGHERIALVNGTERMDFATRRRSGFFDAQIARGITPNEAFVSAGSMTEFSGYEAASRMLEADNPPTAFLASSMLSGMGVRRALEGRGLKLGRDVSVIIFDDELSYLRNGEDLPIFTATRSSVRDAGRIAAQMLLDLITGAAPGPQHRLLEADLIIGQTTGPVLRHTQI
ncbi:MAG: LacI family DNA-binding transcriptional regulator [Microgenomates group bacterium]